MADELSGVIQRATSVRIAEVVVPDPGDGARRRTHAVVSDPIALHGLLQCLAIDARSFDEQISLMTPGDLNLHFMDGHDLVATVTLILPSFIRWARWPSDARLANADGLTVWLRERGLPLT
jgi:hypothetical protein